MIYYQTFGQFKIGHKGVPLKKNVSVAVFSLQTLSFRFDLTTGNGFSSILSNTSCRKEADEKISNTEWLRLKNLLRRLPPCGQTLWSTNLIDADCLYFPTIDTCGCADAQMSTFPCLLLRLISSNRSLLLLLLEVNASFMCAFLCFISLSFS